MCKKIYSIKIEVIVWKLVLEAYLKNTIQIEDEFLSRFNGQ